MSGLPIWSLAWPVAGWVTLAAGVVLGVPAWLQPLAGIALIGTVLAAVYHAEVVAHHIGEPFGTLVLAVAVTIIEVALIVSVMVGAPEANVGLARDAAYAAVMITCNGIVGLCLLLGGFRHHTQGFQVQGASSALAVLAPLTVLTLVVPIVTTTEPGPVFSKTQLAFAGVVSLLLYSSFVFVQTVSHRGFFLPESNGTDVQDHHAPTRRETVASFAVLLAALVAVVGLAKLLTPTIEALVSWANAPKSVIGIVIAALVLLPEGLAAARAAHANRLQTSLNLALGSALASIGLTIPTLALLSLLMGFRIELGLSSKDAVMLCLTLFIGVITLGTGRTTILQGITHLVVFAAFLFFAVIP